MDAAGDTVLLIFNIPTDVDDTTGYTWTQSTNFGVVGTGGTPSWDALYSSSDGYLYATDIVTGTTWLFSLPGVNVGSTAFELSTTTIRATDGARCYNAVTVF